MYGLTSLLCIVIGFVFLAAGLVRILRPIAKKNPQPSVNQPEKRLKKSSNGLIVGILVTMIVLSFWSGFASFFFLLIALITVQSPKGDMSAAVGNTEKSTARRVYTWLFISSLLTVPLFLVLVINSYSKSTTSDEHVLTALAPLLLHLPLLLGLRSRSIFVYRHTQQGIMLIALRAGVAALALSVGNHPEDGLGLFLLGNGSLWLFGSIWGWVQINRGQSWWMNQKGDLISIKGESIAPPKIDPHVKLSPEQYLEYSKRYLKRQLRNSAKEYALEAFRRGNFEIRRQAIGVLDELNEVEFF